MLLVSAHLKHAFIQIIQQTKALHRNEFSSKRQTVQNISKQQARHRREL